MMQNEMAGDADAAVTDDADAVAPERGAPRRIRPKPGERRLQILQTLASMLQEPGGERVTTAALAARLDVSEAALYRHFASKAQMFEGLIQFIEQSVFGLINQITSQEEDGLKQLRSILIMLLGFSDKNPGMTRVLIGDALVNEHDRLQERINQLLDRIESSIKQCFRVAIAQGRLPEQTDAGARANVYVSYVIGRWMRYAKSGFKRPPVDGVEQQIAILLT
ncbi:MAG TPA: nucleoid occlusion factor SlmA [Burkholderiaceae bacterium]|nr:nucleoid occlusion factor SlmA [Burkholderiaceae bacterium]